MEIDEKVHKMSGKPPGGWGSLIVVQTLDPADSDSKDNKTILRFPKADDYL